MVQLLQKVSRESGKDIHCLLTQSKEHSLMQGQWNGGADPLTFLQYYERFERFERGKRERERERDRQTDRDRDRERERERE